jgi:hypothetical protein
MLSVATSSRIAAVNRQERMSDAARWRTARQAERRAAASTGAVRSLTRTARYTRYLVTSLAAVAFGLNAN